jgi:hypothetical protein
MDSKKVWLIVGSFTATINGSGAVSDQKISKFFVFHVKEYMMGHTSVNGVY